MNSKILSATLGALLVCRSGLAMPGDGIRLGPGWTLSPFVEGSVTYDSNVFLSPEDKSDTDSDPRLTRNAEDDFYGDLVGGLSLMFVGQELTANLRGWGMMRRYLEYTDLKDDTFQQNLDIMYGQPTDIQIILSERYSDVSDYEFTQSDTGAKNQEGKAVLPLIEGRTYRTERKLLDLGGALRHDTEKTESEVAVGYAQVDFDEERYFDWSELQGQLNLGYKATDKMTATVVGEGGIQDSDSIEEDATFLKLRLGVRREATPKTSYNLGAGVMWHDAQIGGIDGELEDDITGIRFHFDLAGAWAITRKLDFQCYGRNEVIPSAAYRDNASEVRQLSAGFVYRATERWTTTLGVSHRLDEFDVPINGVDAEEELLGFQWRVEYLTARRFLKVYLKVRHEEFTSNIQADYDQLRATLGLNLNY